MGFIWTIVLGFVIGVLAKLLHPGNENMGWIATVLLLACSAKPTQAIR